MDVTYQLEHDLNVEEDEFLDLLARSGLAERRPVDEPETIRGMLKHADILVTARVEGRLVGIARAITDYSYCTYLSDLAVDEAYQRRGIGKELVRRTHEATGRRTTLILLAAPKAREYYPHIGMTEARVLLDHPPAGPRAAAPLSRGRSPGRTEGGGTRPCPRTNGRWRGWSPATWRRHRRPSGSAASRRASSTRATSSRAGRCRWCSASPRRTTAPGCSSTSTA